MAGPLLIFLLVLVVVFACLSRYAEANSLRWHSPRAAADRRLLPGQMVKTPLGDVYGDATLVVVDVSHNPSRSLSRPGV